jgi:hypothetical protein
VTGSLLHFEVPDKELPNWELLWQWERLKELVANGGMGNDALDQGLTVFFTRIEETRDSYQCLVPEREGEKGHVCSKVVSRRDRMQGHIRSEHLGVRGFQCEGQCGQDGW